ncbi:CAP domain-containing protein [Streptomyces sp. NPDC048389]|uniref:CAP domain-containing protein n=1 Tax=Streptomyces sp. NPDC048389 TaxID=3154622 RepID=UPI0034555DA8
MGSRRAARPHARSHARPKGGTRARSAVLALGVLTVTAGVGVTLATGGGDDASARVETNAAASTAEPSEEGASAADTSPLPTPTPSASPSPSTGGAASAKPKPKPKPKTVPSPTAAPRTKARPTAAAPGGGDGTGGSGSDSGSGAGSGGSGTSGGSGGLDADGPEAQVLALVNQERASAGCSPLTSNAELTRAADDYSDVMARSGVMSHTGPDGSTMTTRVEAAGYEWSTLGENIARGQADAASVMKSWMNSPGHRANILNCSFKELGVGVHFGDGGPWWTQNFGAGR